MLTLYDYLPSQNGWKVRVLLGLLGTPYRTQPVAIFQGESRTAAFLKLNPAGAIPVLQLEDGRAIAESNAILAYLAAGTKFLAADRAADRYAQAKIFQWLFFEQYHIEPVIGSLRYWTLTGRLGVNAAALDDRRKRGEFALAALEGALASTAFLAGDAMTIADIAVYAYAHRAEDAGFSFAGTPAVAAWIARVAAAIGPGYPVHPYTEDAQFK